MVKTQIAVKQATLVSTGATSIDRAVGGKHLTSVFLGQRTTEDRQKTYKIKRRRDSC